MSTVPDEELPVFPFPHDPAHPQPPEYARRRRECPFGDVMTQGGHRAVLLVRAEDVREALGNPRLAHNLTAPGSPQLHQAASFRQDPRLIINMDGEEHLRLRRIVASAFTPRSVDRWRPAIEAIAHELCDDLIAAGPPADLSLDYCFEVPVRVICRLLGVPEEDSERFRHWSEAFLSVSRLSPAERGRQVEEFTGYVTRLIADRRSAPGNQLIDALIEARDGRDRLTEDELLMLVLGLIAVGNEATSNSLGRAVLTLLSDGRKLWDRLADGPQVPPAAVDELLRYSPPGTMISMRRAVEDVPLPSGTVREGQAVVIATGSALRDPDYYPDPDVVDFDRDSPPQLVFGGGPHYCLGAHLAKAELQIGLGVLMRRIPGLRLDADPADIRFSGGDILSTLMGLPVAW